MFNPQIENMCVPAGGNNQQSYLTMEKILA